MNVRKTVLSLIIFAGLAVALSAQQATAVVEYFDDEFEVQLFDADGFELQFFSFGQELTQGSRVRTLNSSLELRLVPNGSIIRVAPNSEVVIDRLQGTTNVEMTMASGRLRHVASRVAGADYRIRSGTVTAGVRGTDYLITENEIVVFSGLVDAIRNDTNEIVSLAAGQAASALSEVFQAVILSAQELSEIASDNTFEQLDPESVPQSTTPDEDEETIVDDDTDDEPEEDVIVTEPDTDPADDEPAAQVPPARVAPAPLPPIITPSVGSPDPGVSSQDAIMADFLGGLGNILSMEIGSITIDGQTYAKAVLQPTIQLGRLRLGLYLPIIYQSDLFDPSDWYQPRGNNEWSFGTDSDFAGEDDEIWLRTQDALRDLALKIRFLEFGQQRDPFFLKLGNLDNLTLGHGVLMRNYANDSEFPAVRRLGFNLGIDGGGSGIELIANDLTEPSIFGSRLFVRPLGENVPFAVGVSGLTDISPARDLPDPATLTGDTEAVEAARAINPIFINVAADIDIPIVETGAFSAVLFADVGGMVPFLRDGFVAGDGTTINSGFRPDTLYVEDGGSISLRNYGIMTGIFGNIGPVDYRLDARNSNGVFRPSFYGQNYDRVRGDRAIELARYLLNPEADEFNQSTYGIYGEAGADLFSVVRLEAGYLWPWQVAAGGGLEPADNDELFVSLQIAPETLPLGLHGGVSYRRTEFAPTVFGRGNFANATLFDANTTFRGEIVYPVAPIMNVVGVTTTTLTRNPDGTIVYDSNGRPEYNWSFTIETRIGM